jgi:hypothetical protein
MRIGHVAMTSDARRVAASDTGRFVLGHERQAWSRGRNQSSGAISMTTLISRFHLLKALSVDVTEAG